MSAIGTPSPLCLVSLVHTLFNLNHRYWVGSKTFTTILEHATKDPNKFLEALVGSTEDTISRMRLFAALISSLPDLWSTFDLIVCRAQLVRRLSNEDHQQENIKILIDETSCQVRASYGSLLRSFRQGSEAAIRSTDAKHIITHNQLYNFVKTFRLPLQTKSVVVIALPNGPLLATICLATATYYTAAPINPATGVDQFRRDVLQACARCIITTAAEMNRSSLQSLNQGWLDQQGISLVLADFGPAMSIELTSHHGEPIQSTWPTPTLNKAEDMALILFTSGTSGAKKVVPLTVHTIVAGCAFVIDSWGLTAEDTCLNMMPLYHVGGLIRNLFAPVWSGGSTICCPVFDPSLFWDTVSGLNPTWYYASPTMHALILAESLQRPDAVSLSQIRLVCNAAGNLLPSLAYRLRDCFECTVLPSYGMTECMPISTPSLDYELERPGTSGLIVGPELSILDGSNERYHPGTIGRICVRGDPVFQGYLKPDGQLDKTMFSREGWFDTGDNGYMDEDGYLFITGRNKEVINRGGELISPFEVEDAILSSALSPSSPLAGKITQALAFSVPHDVLQEVVGIVLVCPAEYPRPDLRALHDGIRSSLQQVKWPVFIVYLDDLPKKNGKLLRINLAERLGLSELTDSTPYSERHWEGIHPFDEASTDAPISSWPCQVDRQHIRDKLRDFVPYGVLVHVFEELSSGHLEVVLAIDERNYPTRAEEETWTAASPQRFLKDPCTIDRTKAAMLQTLHGYLIPKHFHTFVQTLPRQSDGRLDEAAVRSIINHELPAYSDLDGHSLEPRLIRLFTELLSCSPVDITTQADFFTLGGDSLLAGKLLSTIRAEFSVQVPVELVFNDGSIHALAEYIKQHTSTGYDSAPSIRDDDPPPQRTHSSTNPLLLLIQLLPLTLIYPLRRALQWTIFMITLSHTTSWPTSDSIPGRLFNLTLCIFVARTAIRVLAPLLAIAAKWVLIGRYREGLYPMWGAYHTRVWLVQKIADVCGLGMFAALGNRGKIAFYRLMGARIAAGVHMADAAVGEWDLLDIGEGATLDRCICRPFAVERGPSMYLGRIRIGRNAAVGLASVVAPGTSVPDGVCIGPNSSSWEVDGAEEANRDLSTSKVPSGHWALTVLVSVPLLFSCWFFSMTPWFGALAGLVVEEPVTSKDTLYNIVTWFAAPKRVAFHYLALVLRMFLGPFIVFGFSVAVKRVMDWCFGELRPGPVKGRGQIDIWRAALIKMLLPLRQLHSMTEMFGRHYEATSVALRMLGGKAGRRVYWPGTGPSISDYHLVDVGDDVVFGSRAHLVTSDGTSSEMIKIRNGAMIADRVCILPGVTIGENTILGSGAITRRGMEYDAHSTYIGSKGGKPVCISRDRKRETAHEPDKPLSRGTNTSDGTSSAADEKDGAKETATTTTPFGRAFYLKQAPYYVFNQFTIFVYSSFITVFTAFYWNVPSITAIQIADHISQAQNNFGDGRWFDVPALFLLFAAFIAILTTLQALLALAITIAAKWILIGRRQPGNYDWDKSSYCQRWQLYLTIEKLRRHCFRGHGILGMLTGTHWLVVYYRILGAKIGKDCALFANGNPTLLFTEPDLLCLGDRVAVDDASLVSHINSRGKFDLNKLEVGDRCVLRTGSRLLSGATMRQDSCLLEHTLVLSGDVVGEGMTMQGWPAARFKGKRMRVDGETNTGSNGPAKSKTNT